MLIYNLHDWNVNIIIWSSLDTFLYTYSSISVETPKTVKPQPTKIGSNLLTFFNKLVRFSVFNIFDHKNLGSNQKR